MSGRAASGGARRGGAGAEDVLEGRHAVLEALRAGVPLGRVLVAEGVVPAKALDEVSRLAEAAGVRVERVPRADLDRLSERGAHQGIVAMVPPFGYAALEDLLRRSKGRSRSLLVVLDHVTDPHNLGAVVRSAEAAGADGVVVAKRRSAPVTGAVHKASAGAVMHLPVAQVANLPSALRRMKDAGYWVVGASERATETLWRAPLDDRLVVVLGAEGEGLSRLVAETCDFLVRIPVAGKVASLNVAQAATLFAFEWVRRAGGPE